MSEETCLDCGKPLGSTIVKCHDCGGKSRRGGKAIAPHQWQMLLGVEPQNLKNLDYDSRKYGTDAWEESH